MEGEGGEKLIGRSVDFAGFNKQKATIAGRPLLWQKKIGHAANNSIRHVTRFNFFHHCCHC